MPIDFPSSPSVGQQYTYLSVLYTFTAQGTWVAASGLGPTGPSGGPTGSTGPTGPSQGPTGPAGPPVSNDAFAYNGMQINGGMEVSQEVGAAAVTLGSSLLFVVDGWKANWLTVGGGTGQQVTDAPPGYANSIKITVTSASTSPGVGDEVGFFSFIEGYRIARLAWGTANAQSMTIAFWIKAHRPGLYCGAVRNDPPNRSYTFPVQVNVADTWEFKTVTIPGDTTGTWAKDNTAGMRVSVSAMEGSNYITAANIWTAGSFKGIPSMVNGVAATTDTFQITGVVLLPGIQAPTAAQSPNIMRPYDQEKIICKRYFVYETYANKWTFPIDLTSGYRRTWVHFHPEMRIAPVITVTAITSGSFSGTPAATSIAPHSCEISADLSGGGYAYLTSLKADARL